MFSSRLCWSRANQTLASQADRAVFTIKSAIQNKIKCPCHYRSIYLIKLSCNLYYMVQKYGALDMQGLLNMYIENSVNKINKKDFEIRYPMS